MIQIPVNLTNAQGDKLRDLVQRGGDDFLLADQDVNGAPLLVIVARGAARDLVRGWIQGGDGATAEEPVVDQAPPVKVVKVTEGVISRSVPASAGGQPKPN